MRRFLLHCIMSAFGTKRTFVCAAVMSAFGGKADICQRLVLSLLRHALGRHQSKRVRVQGGICHFRFWHKADILTRFNQCPLLGVKRTSVAPSTMSAFDPKRTFLLSKSLQSRTSSTACYCEFQTRRTDAASPTAVTRPRR